MSVLLALEVTPEVIGFLEAKEVLDLKLFARA
jgi:hypothetical protein